MVGKLPLPGGGFAALRGLRGYRRKAINTVTVTMLNKVE